MPLPKGKRNALIIRLWNEGKSNQEILTCLKRAGYKGLADTHSLSGVVSRLKRIGKLPRERPGQELTRIEKEGIREVEEAFRGRVKFKVGKQVDKSISGQVHKRATYYLTPEMIKEIKILAVQRGIDTSELVREIFTEYLGENKER
jgi:hypothetical protein